MQMDDDPDFSNQTSSASCSVDKIEGIYFGACNARFWMLRKHFASMTRKELTKMPFYSWQCITLQLWNRDVDLVIPEQRDMNLILKFLIHKMRTIDGTKGSADKLLKLLNKKGEKEYMEKTKKNFISESVK